MPRQWFHARRRRAGDVRRPRPVSHSADDYLLIVIVCQFPLSMNVRYFS